jgi:hypothetical protein
VREATTKLAANTTRACWILTKPFTQREIAEAQFIKERGGAAAEAILAPTIEVAAPETSAGDDLLRMLSGSSDPQP